MFHQKKKRKKKKSRPIPSHLSNEQNRYLMETKILAGLPGKFHNSLDGDVRRVVEIIHHDGIEPPLKELQHRVAPDVARPARHQNILRH